MRPTSCARHLAVSLALWLAAPAHCAELEEAQSAYARGAYAESIELARQALAGAAAPVRIQALLVLGQAYIKTADYEVALRVLREAEQLARDGGLRRERALAALYTGDGAERMKRHAAALGHYRRALGALALPEDADIAQLAEQQIGDIHVAGGEFEAARGAYERAAAHAESRQDPRAIAQSLDYLGYFNRRLGDLARAIATHERAAQFAAEIGDPVQRARASARAFNHLGICRQLAAAQERAPQAARALLERALHDELIALEQARAGDDRLREGYVLRALATMYRQAAELEPQEARAALERSAGYAAEARTLGQAMRNPEWEGLALHALAVAQARLGELEAAAASFSRALEIWQRIGDVNARGGALRLRAEELAEARGDLEAARRDYLGALEAFEAIQAGDDLAQVHYRLGRLAERAGDRDGAKRAYLRSIEILEALRGRIVSEESRIAFFSRRLDPYEALIRLLLLTGPRAAQDLELAYLASERTRGRALLDLMTRSSERLRAGVDAQTLAAERRHRARVERAERELQQARRPADAVRPRTALEAARRDQDAFYRRLANKYPQYAGLRNPQPLPLAELRSRVLGEGELLLEYFVGQQGSFLFVIARDGLREALPLPPGHEELALAIEKLRRGVAVSDGDVSALARFPLDIAASLYRQLVAPAERHLAGARLATIVPHGPLYYLPFELLVRARREGRDDALLGRFALVEYFIESAPPLRYALSASLLDPRLAPRAPNERVLAVVNPLASGGAVQVAPLQHAQAEAEAVRRLFGNRATVLAGEQATKRAFLAEGGRHGRVLVAAHGIFDEREPMRSGLVLVGERGEYVLLTAEEIFNLRLNARLVSLAACELGLGDLRAGEGLIGLTRAVKYAGAERVAVTLWRVDDRSTAELMSRFYEGLERDGEALSLRSAKLAVLRSRSRVGDVEIAYAHPFFWSAFVLY